MKGIFDATHTDRELNIPEGYQIVDGEVRRGDYVTWGSQSAWHPVVDLQGGTDRYSRSHLEESGHIAYIRKVEAPSQDAPNAMLLGADDDEFYAKHCLNERWSKAIKELHPKCIPFAEIQVEALELHSKKSRDYGSDDDPYANCRGSEDFGVPGWKGVLIRIADKLRRLQAYCRNGSLANEGVEDSFLDTVVYGIIGLILFRQSKEASGKKPA